MTDLRYWIALSYVHDIGPVLSRKLISSFGNPAHVFRADVHDLLSVKGITRDRAEKIRSFDLWNDVEKQIGIIEKKGIHTVTLHDPGYPEMLKDIPDAPVVLYVKGDYCPDDHFGIAVVGSRKHSEYGEVVTRTIAAQLSAAGFTIISGMARGIDTLAHMSALASGGRTIAVFGSGLDICYPAENKGLMERIAFSGCVISEFPPGTKPLRENFPRRNRLISGLSLGCLVIEATRDSGSLLTARYALEQNREVFAVPGNITLGTSAGTNHLIKEGAKIVVAAEDIIEELAPVLKGFITAKKAENIQISDDEKIICTNLSREPKHIDVLTRETGLPAQNILSLLLSLELKGIAKQSHGNRFYLL